MEPRPDTCRLWGAVSVTTEMTLLVEHLRTCQKASEFERGFWDSKHNASEIKWGIWKAVWGRVGHSILMTTNNKQVKRCAVPKSGNHRPDWETKLISNNKKLKYRLGGGGTHL